MADLRAMCDVRGAMREVGCAMRGKRVLAMRSSHEPSDEGVPGDAGRGRGRMGAREALALDARVHGARELAGVLAAVVARIQPQ